MVLEFEGKIRTDEDSSPAMMVLLLKPLGNPRVYNISVLALASENREHRLVKAKANVLHWTYSNHSVYFEENQRWQATYLGSLVTLQRMFDACLCDSCPISKCISQGMTNFTPPTRVVTNNSHLNDVQFQSTVAFSSLALHATLLLQGPPGTGKTTTLTYCLRKLLETPVSQLGRRSRALVCAGSNKAVQVLAEKVHASPPIGRIILVAVESKKIPDTLRAITLQDIVGLVCIVERIKSNEKLTLQFTRSTKEWIRSVIKVAQSMDNGKLDAAVADYLCDLVHTANAALSGQECSCWESVAAVAECLRVNKRNTDCMKAWSAWEKLSDCVIRDLGATYDAENTVLTAYSDTLRFYGHDIVDDMDRALQRVQRTATTSMTEGRTVPILLREFRQYCMELIGLKECVEKKSLAMEQDLLQKADFVFATLSTSGRNMMGDIGSFDYLVIDEAAQAVEAEVLIALKHKPGRLVLVGDTNQLPATVLSLNAKAHHYDWSLMHRLQNECNAPKMMLTTHFRMHPAICQFPSERWYEGALNTSSSLTFSKVSDDDIAQPYAFYDMSRHNNGMTTVDKSKCNPKEAQYASMIVSHIRSMHPEKSIGVITFYRAQVDEINRVLPAESVGNPKVVVTTVDGTQGGEMDIVILSFVRFASDGK
jgi:uncharacterized protein YggL (DUF469 family)